MISTMLAGAAVGVGTQVAGQVQGQVQGMATNMLSSVTGGITSTVSNFVTNLVGGIFSGPTGAAGVDMENERKKGDALFHGVIIGGKWRDFDYVLKTMNGKGLTSYGWGDGKVPRSAQGIFKDAENAFFTVLRPFLDKVINGQASFPESFLNDSILVNYVENGLKAKQSVAPKTSTAVKSTVSASTALDTKLTKATTSPTKAIATKTTKSGSSFPWWTLLLLGL